MAPAFHQARAHDTHGTVVGRKRFVQPGHVAAYDRGPFHQITLRPLPGPPRPAVFPCLRQTLRPLLFRLTFRHSSEVSDNGFDSSMHRPFRPSQSIGRLSPSADW
jgi:hypothetical protein